MSAWRRYALALLPEHAHELARPQTDVYEAFARVRDAFDDAVERGDADRLRELLAYGAWAMRQRAQPLWNSAAVMFLEHIFDHSEAVPLVAPLVPPEIVRDVWGLWAARGSEERLERVRQLLRQAGAL